MPKSKEKYNDLIGYLESIIDSLTPTQKVLANYLIGNLTEAAFLSTDEMAQKVDTTPSTVVRFAKEIGFRGFPDLQNCLRQLLIKKVNTMGQFQHAKKVKVKGESEALNASLIKDIESLNKLNDMRSDTDIIEFVKILSDSKKKYIIASRSIFSIGHFFYFQARKILPGVIFLNNYDCGIFDFIRDLQQDDVVVALSFPRYNHTTIEFSKFAREKGVKVICITDSRISPLFKISEISLFCPHESSSFFTSHVASMALVNGIISELFAQNYNSAIKNLEIEESLLLKLNILGTKGRMPRKKLEAFGS